MTPSFVRRAIAAVGLLALAPLGLMLARGQIAPVDAGIRGAVTLVFVRVAVGLSGWMFRRAALAAARSSRQRGAARQGAPAARSG